VLNNPIRYIDPTGHVCSDPDDPDQWCSSGNPYPNNTQPLPEGPIVINNPDPLDDGQEQDDPTPTPNSIGGMGCNFSNLIYCVNQWLWYNVPSAFGLHIGASGQLGAGIFEPGLVPFEFLLLANWRSGEISWFYTGEAFVYAGSPSLFGGNVYGGWTTVKGLSKNANYEGAAWYAGATAGADVFGKVGISKVKGWAQDPDSMGGIPTTIFIDVGSGLPVIYEQTSITFGGNLGANGIDVGVFGGFASTTMLWPR